MTLVDVFQHLLLTIYLLMNYTNQTDLFSLQDKVALVSGGSGDIGLALAKAMAKAGASIALNGTSQAKLDKAGRELESLGARVALLKADISKASECTRLAQEAQAAFGRIDILVNCAGINRRKPILEITEDDYNAIMDVHVRGSYFLSQAVAPIMIGQGGGKIIHIGSLNIKIGLADISVYGVAKAGLDQLTRVQAVEWAQHNIQVNCLSPGFIETDLTRVGLWQNEKRSKWILERTPMKRPGYADEMAGVMLLLASNASSFLTGQTIYVDGGVLAGSAWW
ncbi:MAG: SDR family oxidoreductase [Anaerolineae bacterium]|nr:SDR family oxidoreductase [Anaerolineae bacterium]